MNIEPTPYNPYSAPAVAGSQIVNDKGIDLNRYATVRSGLQLIYYSVAAIAGFTIFFMVFGLFGATSVTPGNANSTSPFLLILPMLILGLAFLVAALAMFIGFCMCAACPMPDEKTRAYLTIGAFVLSFLVSFGVGFIQSLHPGISIMLSLVAQIPIAISTTAFCLLLMRIGKNILSDNLKRQSARSLGWLALTMGTFLTGFLALAVNSNLGNYLNFSLISVIPWTIAMVVLSLGTFFQFLHMIRTGIIELKPQR